MYEYGGDGDPVQMERLALPFSSQRSWGYLTCLGRRLLIHGMGLRMPSAGGCNETERKRFRTAPGIVRHTQWHSVKSGGPDTFCVKGLLPGFLAASFSKLQERETYGI